MQKMQSLVMTPWSDFDELQTVYNCIYGINNESDTNKTDDYIDCIKYATNKLTIWLSRNASHSIDTQLVASNAHLMATHVILNAFIKHHYITNDSEQRSCGDQTAIYSLYALAVIRFCTAITQHSSDKTIKSVKRLADRYCCPQWIIECRHALCHLSHNQPSLHQLREASHFALKWLRHHYWDQLIVAKSAPDCYALIAAFLNVNKNDKKLKKNIRNEMISALKCFANEFIVSFAMHLLDITKYNCDNNEKPNSLEMQRKSLRKFAPIFARINQTKCCLTQLLYRLVYYLNDDRKQIRHCCSCWLRAIITAIKTEPKASRFERAFVSINHTCLMPRIEWIRLLYEIVKRPNEYTSHLISLIAPFVKDLIGQKKLEKLISLSKLYSEQYISKSECLNSEPYVNDSDRSDVKSVQNLLQSINDSGSDDWQKQYDCLKDTTDWQRINIGATVLLSNNNSNGNSHDIQQQISCE